MYLQEVARFFSNTKECNGIGKNPVFSLLVIIFTRLLHNRWIEKTAIKIIFYYDWVGPESPFTIDYNLAMPHTVHIDGDA